MEEHDLAAWRELYGLAAKDPHLRSRILGIVGRVPLPFPSFWRAAMSSLGERVDWSAPLPSDPGIACPPRSSTQRVGTIRGNAPLWRRRMVEYRRHAQLLIGARDPAC